MTGATRRPSAGRRLVAALVAVAASTGLVACGGFGPTISPTAGASSGTAAVERYLVYREIADDVLKMDACLPPDADAPLPSVLVVHGGAFEVGDRTTMLGVCQELAGVGFAAFTVDYRLVPSVYPAQVEDVSAAAAWLREPAQKERFGLGDSLSLFGSSAGAIIALSTAASLAEAGNPVSAVVGLSGAGDFTPAAARTGVSADIEQAVLTYLGCPSVEDCPTSADASPLTHAADLPPTLLIHGSQDIIPLAQAEALDAALESSGVEHELIVVDGDNHGLQLLNSRTRPEIARFLREHASS